jgi:hypothetical protein
MAEQSQVSFQRTGDAILVRLSGAWRLRGGVSSEATVQQELERAPQPALLTNFDFEHGREVSEE